MTPTQKRLLDLIRAYIESHDGVSPTFEEMMVGMGLRSKSGVGRLVSALVDQKLIRRDPHRARGIELTAPEPLLDPATALALKVYCEKTKGLPRLVIADALREYFGKRRFVAGDNT